LQIFDLAIAWCWKYDADFIFQIDKECGKRGLFSYLVHPHNLFETMHKIDSGELGFKVFFDRASDQEEEFDGLVDLMKAYQVRMINDVDRALWSSDKATMHLEFLTHGINVPYTIILPPYEENPDLDSIPLEKVGKPFVIKPACGGCGDGVVLDAQSIKDIQITRQEYANDKYLLQEKIIPVQIGKKRAWFRVFYVCGEVLPCWWDDQTRIADILSPSQIDEKIYLGIEQIIRKIASISKLDIFSTEIALIPPEKLLVIDHANDQVDLRKKSSHFDGIPDEVVDRIVFGLVDWVQRYVARTSIRTEFARCKKI
jgi:hypothetical protein